MVKKLRPLPITRTVENGEFVYRRRGQQLTNSKVLDRIATLAIPPAWNNVEIATSPSAKILARGIDAAGRVQAIYHPRFRAKQNRAKFDRSMRFAERLPTLRTRLETDLRRRSLRRERVIACIITLLDEELFRIGSSTYAKQHETFGVTTLRKAHVNANGSSVTFSFVGKSGKPVERVVKDPRIVTIVGRLSSLSGDELFAYIDEEGDTRPVIRTEVNTYLKRVMGDEFSAKDFRTWGGTVHAMEAILRHELDASIEQVHRDAVKTVAKHLGNTAAVAKSSYIDPRLFRATSSVQRVRALQRKYRKLRDRKHFSRAEQLTLQAIRRFT